MNEADSSGYEEPEAQGGNDSSTVGGGEGLYSIPQGKSPFSPNGLGSLRWLCWKELSKPGTSVDPSDAQGVPLPRTLAPLPRQQFHLASAGTRLHLQTALISSSLGEEVI